MLSVKEARERILEAIAVLPNTMVELGQARGRILAEPALAATDLPSFDNSSVDGFALRSSDISHLNGESTTLEVVADIPAGNTQAVSISPGQAARIMTGALMPAGADAVVMVEDTDFNQRAAGSTAPKYVKVFRKISENENIRRRGADILSGQVILPAGHALRPQDLGLLAMQGFASVNVRRRPRIALISSGSELVPVEATLEPGKIRDSNSHMLAALAESLGCEILRMGVAADDFHAVKNLFEQAAAAQPDMILASAGVSVGAYDFVREVVESAGALGFWKVNMRPGKPLAFGNYRNIPFFGLPGNPVSAFVAFVVFVRPAIQRLQGQEPGFGTRIRAILKEPVESDGRESYLRAVIQAEDGVFHASLAGHQGSGNLFSLVQANALLIIPSGVKSCPPGSEVEAWIMEN